MWTFLWKLALMERPFSRIFLKDHTVSTSLQRVMQGEKSLFSQSWEWRIWPCSWKDQLLLIHSRKYMTLSENLHDYDYLGLEPEVLIRWLYNPLGWREMDFHCFTFLVDYQDWSWKVDLSWWGSCHLFLTKGTISIWANHCSLQIRIGFWKGGAEKHLARQTDWQRDTQTSWMPSLWKQVKMILFIFLTAL